jgi:hypothetical protein
MKSSPLNELTAQDIVRKKIKMQKIKDQMNPEHEAYRPGAQKKLAEKQHKTKYQIDTGKRGRPTSLRNEEWLAGPSRKSSSPVNNYKDGYYGVERKSALNMLGIQSKSPLNDMTQQENVADDFEAQWAAGMAGQEDVELGTIKSTERGKKIAAIKKDVSETEDGKLVMPKQHDFFVTNPTEGSDEMAVKIQDAKNITKAGGPYPQGITTKGEHYVKVEKPLQEELSEKMLLKNRRNK